MVGVYRAAAVAALVAVGCFFLTVGTVGLLRFPNVYNRMHATSKPTTLGTATVFLAGFVYFWPAGAALTCLVGILFLFLTVPTGAHMIARSAERMGVPFVEGVTWPAIPGRVVGDESESAPAPGPESTPEREPGPDPEPGADDGPGGDADREPR